MLHLRRRRRVTHRSSLQRYQRNIINVTPGAIRVPGPGALDHSTSFHDDDVEDSEQFSNNENFVDDPTPVVETVDEEEIRQRVLQEVPYGTVIQSGHHHDDAGQPGNKQIQQRGGAVGGNKKRQLWYVISGCTAVIVVTVIVVVLVTVLGGEQSSSSKKDSQNINEILTSTYAPTDVHPLKSTPLFQFIKDKTY